MRRSPKRRFGSKKFLNRITQLASRPSAIFISVEPYGAELRGAPMSLLERIPTLTDEEVANLLANARRLVAEGDEKQRVAAEGLLPALEEADAERRQARQERAKEKRAATRKATLRQASAAAA
jgi:hypothetical protein